VIGHLKSDYRLARNYLKGIMGDEINILMAAAAMNFKRVMNLWLTEAIFRWKLILKIILNVSKKNIAQTLNPTFEGRLTRENLLLYFCNMKKTLILFVFIIISFIGNAQKYITVKGTVIDSLDNTPLINATINIDYGKKIFLSDNNGKFSLTYKQQDLIMTVKVANYLPYRTVLNFNKDTTLYIQMNSLVKQLNNVNVSTRGSESNVKKPIMGVSTLSVKEIGRMPAILGEIDVLRSVQMLPGVSSVGEASNGVNIRGGTTDQNLILLEGTTIFNATHMFGLFSAFPSEALSNFDLYKGNVPSRYGGRVAGVLDVNMKTPSLDKTKTQIGLGLVSQKILIETPLIKDKLSVLMAGRGAFNDFLLPKVSPKLDNIKAKFGDWAGKIFYRVNNSNTLNLTAYQSFDNATTNLIGSVENINSTSSIYRYKTFNVSGNWTKVINKNLTVQILGSSANFSPTIGLPELNSTNEVEIVQSIKNDQLKLNTLLNIGKHNLEFGIDGTNYTINPGELKPNNSTSINSFRSPIEKGLEVGAYLEDEFKLSEKIAIIAGIRYSSYYVLGNNTYNVYKEGLERNTDNISGLIELNSRSKANSYSGFEPRIGATFTLNKTSSIKLAYNAMRQYLQVISNTTTPIPTSRWKSSDLFTKPQVAQLFSLGYFKNLNENIYETSVEAYYRNTNNIMDYKPGASFLLEKNIETQLLQGKNKSYGLEFSLNKKKGELTGWFNYTYSRSLNKVDSGPRQVEKVNNGNWYASNFDKPHTVNLALVIKQTEMHDFSFNFTYSSGRPFTTPSAFVRINNVNIPYYNQRNNSRIPDYHRLDFAWNIYNPKNLTRKYKGNWNFTIYNLYGRKNAYSVFLRTENNLTNAYKLIIFGSPIPSIGYNFKLE
jgi:hypothetical protein